MNEENIKASFNKVKEEIYSIKKNIINLNEELESIKDLLRELVDEINTQKLQKIAEIPPYSYQTDNQTLRQINETHNVNKTDNKTVPQEIEGLINQNIGISTGNRGVKTDRQTDRQTDKIDQKSSVSIEADIQEASFILDSLDRLKRDIRLKFKRVTEQEMSVFSTIYQLEEEYPQEITYKKIAKNLNLSESAIRDYVRRMLLKGIPIKKEKINNKKVILSISEDLKKIASLSTII